MEVTTIEQIRELVREGGNDFYRACEHAKSEILECFRDCERNQPIGFHVRNVILVAPNSKIADKLQEGKPDLHLIDPVKLKEWLRSNGLAVWQPSDQNTLPVYADGHQYLAFFKN